MTLFPAQCYLDLLTFQLKKIPSLYKIEVEKIHSIWLSSAGTHQREPDVEGLTAGRYGLLALRSAKCKSLANFERKFCTCKSWFSNYDILLLLMLLTPAKRGSITVNMITVWAFLNPCHSLKVLLKITSGTLQRPWKCRMKHWATFIYRSNSEQHTETLSTSSKVVYSQQYKFKGTFFCIFKRGPLEMLFHNTRVFFGAWFVKC